jgi:hypothetical protein
VDEVCGVCGCLCDIYLLVQSLHLACLPYDVSHDCVHDYLSCSIVLGMPLVFLAVQILLALLNGFL